MINRDIERNIADIKARREAKLKDTYNSYLERHNTLTSQIKPRHEEGLRLLNAGDTEGARNILRATKPLVDQAHQETAEYRRAKADIKAKADKEIAAQEKNRMPEVKPTPQPGDSLGGGWRVALPAANSKPVETSNPKDEKLNKEQLDALHRIADATEAAAENPFNFEAANF